MSRPPRSAGKAEPVRREHERRVELLEMPERDLLDSPSDSWRDLELRVMLDEIGGSPAERADS